MIVETSKASTVREAMEDNTTERICVMVDVITLEYLIVAIEAPVIGKV